VFHSPDGSAALDHTSILKTVEPARAHRQGRGRPGRRAQPHRTLTAQRDGLAEYIHSRGGAHHV